MSVQNLDTVIFMEMDTEALREAHNDNFDYLDAIMGDDIAKVEKQREEEGDDNDDDEE